MPAPAGDTASILSQGTARSFGRGPNFTLDTFSVSRVLCQHHRGSRINVPV